MCRSGGRHDPLGLRQPTLAAPPAAAPQVGGFDPRYSRGYYEDVDLAMRVAASGTEVLVQPLALVFHEKGTTFGGELTDQLVAANREAFVSRWKAELQAREQAALPMPTGVIAWPMRHAHERAPVPTPPAG